MQKARKNFQVYSFADLGLACVYLMLTGIDPYHCRQINQRFFILISSKQFLTIQIKIYIVRKQSWRNCICFLSIILLQNIIVIKRNSQTKQDQSLRTYISILKKCFQGITFLIHDFFSKTKPLVLSFKLWKTIVMCYKERYFHLQKFYVTVCKWIAKQKRRTCVSLS